MNEELSVAIDELRIRPADKAWFIPVLLAPCEVPDRPIGGGERLADLQWLDMSQGWEEGVAKLTRVIRAETGNENSEDRDAPQVRLTAREAARLVKKSARPRGNLFGLSQKGITQQYISQHVMGEGDWLIADAKTGKSAIWIVDFFSQTEATIDSFGVFNGSVVPFPTLHVQGNEPRTIDFNFIDSDIAVSKALKKARASGIGQLAESYFITTRLRYYSSSDFLWSVFFMDVALRRSFFTVSLSARDGTIVE